jgi:type III pantothenate kinase
MRQSPAGLLFVMDVGNTNVVAGIYALPKPKRLAKAGAPLAAWRFATDRSKTPDEYQSLLRGFLRQAGIAPSRVQGAILASVVPALVPVMEGLCLKLFGLPVMLVGPGLDLGLSVATRDPLEVGADRLVNAVAARARWSGPLVVLDFGTATTVDAVSARGEYLGGAIAPGVLISAEALASRTAKLPRIEMERPARAIGRSTIESMRSGIYHGTVGQVRELLGQVARELGGKPTVVATGGLSRWLPLKELGIHHSEPDLTLQGLCLIWARNAPKHASKAPSRSPRVR